MYQSIFELPSQVRASLDETDQSVWMAAYNKLKPKSEKDIRKAMKEAWHACEKLPSSFSFCIRATSEDIDNTQEVMDAESIKKCMDSFIEYGGNVQYEHSNFTVAVVWDWAPEEKDGVQGIKVWGNVFGGDKVYDTMRKSFVKGTNSMSIGGVSTQKSYQCDDKGCYIRRKVDQLMEISLCKRPTNRHAKLEWYNEDARLRKSDSETFSLGVTDYEIHRDYTTCPILGLKKSLQDIGYMDATARKDGVFIPMSEEEFRKSAPYMAKNNLLPRWLGDGVLLNDRDDLLEKHFKKGLSEGYIDEKGYLLKGITREQISEMYYDDVIGLDNGRYRLIPCTR